MNIPSISALLTILELDPDGSRVLVWPEPSSFPSLRLQDSLLGARGPDPAARRVAWFALLEVAPSDIRCEVTWASGARPLVGEAALAFLETQGQLCWEYRSRDDRPPSFLLRALLPPAPPRKQLPAAQGFPAGIRSGQGSGDEAEWVPRQTDEGRLRACRPERLDRDLLRPLLLVDGRRTAREIARLLWRQLPEDEAQARALSLLHRLRHIQLII